MSAQDLANAAYSAGFRGDGLTDAIAVGLAESSGNLTASHVNGDWSNSVDRGPWQINSYWHPEVSDACAFDWACSAQAAFRISSGGSDWSQWATWTGGAYREHLEYARQLAASVGGSSSPPASSAPAPANGAPAGSSIPPSGAPSSRWIVGGLIAAVIAVVLLD